MKVPTLLSLILAGSLLGAATSRAEDPTPAVPNLPPELQAILNQMIKAATEDAPEPVSGSTTAPTPETKPAASTSQSAAPVSSLHTGRLQSGTLQSHGLSAASLTGKATSGSEPRMSDEIWHQLFSLKMKQP